MQNHVAEVVSGYMFSPISHIVSGDETSSHLTLSIGLCPVSSYQEVPIVSVIDYSPRRRNTI